MVTPARQTSSAPTAARRVRSPAAVAAFALLALALIGVFAAAQLYVLDGSLGLPLDDSWIHLSFARNLAAGHGLGINPGELVAGSTAPLWTAVVALATLLPGSDLLWMELLGVALYLGGAALVWALGRRLGLDRALAALAVVFTLATGWLAWSALSGMEISLFVFLSLAGMLLHLRERSGDGGRAPLSLAVLGVAALARPEGLLLLGCAAADRLLVFRRAEGGALAWRRPGRGALGRLLAGAGLAALAVVPVALLFVWIDGSPVPTTLAAKTDGGSGPHLPDLQYLQVAFGILLRSQPWLTVLAPAGAVELIRRLGTPRDRGLLPALWLAGLPLAYSCLTPPGGGPLVGNFGRYLFPLLPIVVLLGVLGLEPLERALRGSVTAVGGERPRWPVPRRLAAGVVLLLLLVPTAVSFGKTAVLYGRNVSDIARGDVRMARFLAARLPESAVVATMDIGALSAILPNRIVDLAGIGDPEVYDFVDRAVARGGSWQDGVLDFIRARRPDYLVVFPGWLRAVERPGSPYRRILTLKVRGNVTLGRDTLGLYATPWTRVPLRPAAETPSDEPVPAPDASRASP